MTILTHLLAAMAGSVIGAIIMSALAIRRAPRPHCICRDGFFHDRSGDDNG